MGVAEMVGQQNLTDLVVSRSATHRKPPTGLEIEPEIDGIQEQVLATPLACSTVQRARQRPRAASLRPFPPTKEIEADPEFSLKPSRSKPASARSRNVKGGPSRHRGVVWHKSNCKWEARIYENGRQKFLGYHLDEDEAAMAYDDYAVKLHGTAARLNFPHRYEHILGPLLPAQPRQLPARSAGVKKSRSPRSAATSSRSRSRHSRPAAPPSPHTPKESDPVFTRQHWHPKHQPPSPADSTSGSPLHAGAAAQLQQAKRAGHGEAPLSLGVTDPGGGRAGQGKVHAAPWPRGYTAPPVKGSSKFRGVSWNSSCGKWRAQVWQGSEVHHLGYFREEEDAARAYDEAAVQIRGPAAATNFAVVEAGEGSHMDWSPGRCSSPPSGQDAELAALVLSQLAADVEGGERWRWEAEIAGDSWQSAPTAPACAGHPSHAPLKLSATTVTTRRGGFPPSKAPLSLHEPPAGHQSPRNNPVPQIEHVEHAAHGRDCTTTGLPLPQQPCPLPLFVGPSPAPSSSPADTPSVGRTLPAAATPASDAEAPVSELEDPQGGRGTPCADPPPSKYRGASGYMGVSWDKRKQKWFSQIQQHGRRHFLGYFEEEGEAGRAYDRAAVRLYGSQAQLNFPSECASLPWAKGGGRMEGFGCSLERVQGAGGALQEAARVTQELLQAASTAGRAGAAGTAAACQLADVAEQGGRHLRRLSLVSRPGEGRGGEGGGLPSCSHSMLSVPDYRELLGQLSAAAGCPAPLTPTAPLTLPRQHAAQHDQQGHTVASAGSSGSSGYACHDHHPSTSLPPPQLTTHFVPAQQPTSPPITGSFPEAVQGTSGGKGGGWEGGLHPLTLAIAEAHQTSPRGVMLQT